MMPFDIQRNNSSIDNSPSKNEINKNEIDLVNKKVVKTKQEIEYLKFELQKLINTGLFSENENPTKGDPKNTAQLSCNGQQTSDNNTNCDIDKRNNEMYVTAGRENIILKFKKSCNNSCKINQVPSNITTRFDPISLRKFHVSNNENKIDCRKKKLEYNKEQAREYIKKQREKRAEQMKAKIKETQNEIDLRKKKLKELHEKSLQLVSKNLKQKKKRCQSCDNKVTISESNRKQPLDYQNGLACNVVSKVSNAATCFDESNCNFNNDDKKPSAEKLSYENLKVTTKRKINGLSKFNSYSASPHNVDTQILESTVNRDQLLYNAATKIQAYFRGFRQRKLYRNEKNANLKQENFIQTNKNNLEKPKHAWLDVPATLPYPYNFINAVKKKLSYAVNKTINERNDYSEFLKSRESIAVRDHLEIKRNSDNIISNPVLSTIENSKNHHQPFNKETESTIYHIEKNFKDIQFSKSDITLRRNKGIPSAQPLDFQINLSKGLINRTNSSNNPCNLKSFLSDKCLDLDFQTIKPLSLKPLQIDSQYIDKNTKRDCTSDSDTSKNIPDLSTESSVNTKINKQVKSSNSSESSNSTDDYNLLYNRERHNKLRRSRRQKIKKTDETVQTLLPHHNTDRRDVEDKKEEIVKDLGANCSISGYFSPLSKGHKKHLPLANIISNTNNSGAANNAHELDKIICNTEASCSEKEDMGNTTMLSSFLSYMHCLGVETYTKSNVENEVDLEKNKSTAASLQIQNSNCKELKLSNLTDDVSEIDESIYSSDFESLSIDKKDFVPSLKCPAITLNTSHVSLHKTNDQITYLKVPFNKTFQFEKPKTIDTKANSNEIHLKFEAEIRLLHHFNKSLQEAVEKEKSLLENHYVSTGKNGYGKIIEEKHTNNAATPMAKSKAKIETINYSRGSDVLNSSELVGATSRTSEMFENSFLSNTNLDLSSVGDFNKSDNKNNSSSTILSLKKQHKDNLYQYPGLSLEMFDQLIKDEDARIENLKTILKIREKSLLDRTKSELAWLEIQKRYLKDSGQLNEISMIKKKQRGLLVKLQHERHEMQRLKQLQKAASKERKTRLRHQRNMIKAQLSTNNETVSRLKSSLLRERRHSSGPLKVVGVYRYNESETLPFLKEGFATSDSNDTLTLSRSSESIASELLTDRTVTSSHSDFPKDSDPKQQEFRHNQNEHLKRSLLIRETALQKRRKLAEELLQWHQRLVEEERQIAELESAANSIISQVTANPCFSIRNESSSPNFTFKGCQLNVMWHNMTGRQGQRFNDSELYIMSNEAIQQFCKDAKKNNEDRFSLNIISNSDSSIKVDNHNVSTEIDNNVDLQNQENNENELHFLSTSSANLTKGKGVTEKTIDTSSVVEPVENIPNETREKVEANQTSYSEDFEENSLNIYADFLPKIQNEIKLECVPLQNVNFCCKNESTADINELNRPMTDITVSIQAENIDNNERHISYNESTSEFENDCFEINTETNVPGEPPYEIKKKSTNTENNSHTLNEITYLSVEKTIQKDIASFKYISTSTLTGNRSRCEKEINRYCSKEARNNSVEHLSTSEDCNKESKNLKTSIPDVINKVSDYVPQNMASDSLLAVQNKLRAASEVIQVSKITEMPDILYKTCAYEDTNAPSTISEIIFKNTKGDLSASNVDFRLAIVDAIRSERSFEFNKDQSASTNENNFFYVTSNSAIVRKYKEESEKEPETDNKNVGGQFESGLITTGVVEKNGEDGTQKETESGNELLSKNEIEKSLKNVNTKKKIMAKEAEFKKDVVFSSDNIVKRDNGENIVAVNDLEKESCDYNNMRRRIFEIFKDANISRTEPNFQFQNLHVSANSTASSPAVSPESEILLLDEQILSKHTFASEEEEELVKKQLAIEQEIKQIEQQQQKEYLPYVYLREIPNKPPPPYMPPNQTTAIPSVLPSSAEQVNLIVHHISNYLFNAHLNGTLPNISLLPEIKRQMQNQIEPACQTFIFDLCKELTVEHYKQFEEESEPSWMRIIKGTKLAFQKAFDERTLEKFLMKKVKETLGYEKTNRKESMIIKWSRKKRDHVDELLVLESQNEEAEWTNYDKDELIVINEITNEIVNSLIDETALILQDIMAKRIKSPYC